MEAWKERIVTEYKQLRERKNKLKEFLNNPSVNLSTEERDMLVVQYSGILLYQ